MLIWIRNILLLFDKTYHFFIPIYLFKNYLFYAVQISVNECVWYRILNFSYGMIIATISSTLHETAVAWTFQKHKKSLHTSNSFYIFRNFSQILIKRRFGNWRLNNAIYESESLIGDSSINRINDIVHLNDCIGHCKTCLYYFHETTEILLRALYKRFDSTWNMLRMFIEFSN